MGWKEVCLCVHVCMSGCKVACFQSSDGVTSLSMPVVHKVLKAVIDFMYTDEIQVTIKGNVECGPVTPIIIQPRNITAAHALADF